MKLCHSENGMRHIIYETKNLINGMLYRGKRSTDSLEDGYLGSGTLFLRALKKYGKECFERTILFEAFDEESAYWAEEQLVNQEFCDREDTYNIVPGGRGISKKLACQINKERVQNGTHPFQGKNGTELAIKRNLKLSSEGLHPFQNIEKQTERVRERVKDGTHNFLDSDFQSTNAKKRVQNGTHPLLGKGMMTVIDLTTNQFIRIDKNEYFEYKNIRYRHPRSKNNE